MRFEIQVWVKGLSLSGVIHILRVINKESFSQLYTCVIILLHWLVALNHIKLVSELDSWLREIDHKDEFYGDEVQRGKIHREEWFRSMTGKDEGASFTARIG